MLIKAKSLLKPGQASCLLCDQPLTCISTGIGICPSCARLHPEEARKHIELVHAASRESFGLPTKPAANPEGIECKLCFHKCKPGRNQKGYCGVRHGSKYSFKNDGRSRALVSFYYDPLPTNCVADWVCAGGTGAGYPEFSHEDGPEVGFYNLAVFFEACNFNCLYCQNWTFKKNQLSPRWSNLETLEQAVNINTSCICFFGGDPGPQLPYAVRLSEAVRAKHPDRILRICWETNGSMHRSWLRKMARLSCESGGCIKVDLKAWAPGIHRALTGFDNKAVLDNFVRVADLAPARCCPPLLVASTPLVPGYIDEDEIYGIASFIARIDPDIPYTLLAFGPQFMMDDSPTTSAAQAQACLEAAKNAGLTRVRLGNEHMIG